MSLSRREQTEQRIMQALEDQISEAGMLSVGVNVIAKRAGVSKELIYRYFDGLPGLMLQWMKTQDFWTGKSSMLLGESIANVEVAVNAESMGTPGDDVVAIGSQDIVLAMLRAQANALFDNQALREIRRWELIERNEVSAQLSDRREKLARRFIDRLSEANDTADVDMPATVSVLLAGVLYLALRSKTESHFLGVPIRTDEGWERIYQALEHLVKNLPDGTIELSGGEL